MANQPTKFGIVAIVVIYCIVNILTVYLVVPLNRLTTDQGKKKDLRELPTSKHRAPHIKTQGICSQEIRKNNIKELCQRYGKPGEGTARMVMDDKRKIAYCFVEKSGCSTWKALMSNISSYGSIQHEVRKGEIHRIIDQYGLNYAFYNKSYVDYTKFMVVRHPFDRLLSAYFDKMRTDGHWDGAKGEVIQKYRNDKTLTIKYPTFEEFTKMVLDDPTYSMARNKHWSPYILKCSPCQIEYDYILKTESMSHDMLQLLTEVYQNESTVYDQVQTLKNKHIKHVNLSERKHEVSFSNVKSKLLEKEFTTLNSTLVRELNNRFFLEMSMLGYSYSKDYNGTYYAHCEYQDVDKTCC